MPLVRYNLINEYKLASRELFKTAPKNDSEATLEGVAVVGLVGTVRQLGNLAEFAADMFHDLHEEVMAVAARGHKLQLRVQQLQEELPSIEKFFFSEMNQLRFAYSTASQWRSGIPIYQNHCTEGGLPLFIQNSYQECRGPPRLFLLDKFDSGGGGACLKRYSDPSYFKVEWARVQLQKAEKERKIRQGKKSRRHKDPKKPIRSTPRRIINSALSCSIPNIHLKATTSTRSNSEDQSAKSETSVLVSHSERHSSKNIPVGNNPLWRSPESLERLKESSKTLEKLQTLKLSAKDIEAETASKGFHNFVLASKLRTEPGDGVALLDENTIEGDQFADAVATMESDTESEIKAREESDSDMIVDASQPQNTSSLLPPSTNGGLIIEKGYISSQESDDMSEDMLESVDLVLGSSQGSHSMSSSHSTPNSLTDHLKPPGKDDEELSQENGGEDLGKITPVPCVPCHQSSRIPGSHDLSSDDDEPMSPKSSCISIELSPKSPIFSALDSPLSPLRNTQLSKLMHEQPGQIDKMKPSSPTDSTRLSSLPNLEAERASLSPRESGHCSQKLKLQPAQANIPLSATPIPPPPPVLPEISATSAVSLHFSASPMSLGLRNHSLIESISLYDRSKLKKVIPGTPSRALGEREVLLEQIRSRSFSLRRTKLERSESLPSTSAEKINAAAILEKANAIRQAFIGSDEESADEDWNET